MTDFKKFKEKLLSKKKFYSSLTGKTISDKEYDHVLDVWNKFEMKTTTYSHDFYLECDNVMLGHLFEKFKNNSLKNSRPYPIII